MKLPDNEAWAPKRITFSFGEPILQLSKLHRQPTGFVSDVDLIESEDSITIPLMDIDIPPGCAGLSGLIYHLPRSGSTAVAKAVARAIGNATCYFEPTTVNELTVRLLTHDDFETIWLQRLLALYGACYGRTGPVIIKLSSWSLLCLREFQEAARLVPGFFVYRDPEEVVLQLLERPAGWMQPDIRPYILRLEGQEPSGNEIEIVCSVLCSMLRHVLNGRERLIAIPHHKLERGILTRLIPGLGLSVDLETVHRVRRSLSLDSEYWSDEFVYRPDSSSIMRQSTDETRAQVSPIYALIERFEQDDASS